MGNRSAGWWARLLAAASGALVLAGCGSGGASTSGHKQYRMGLVIDGVGNEFHTRVEQSALQTANQKGVQLIVLDSNRDTATESADVDQLITQRVDMIMVVATSAQGTPAALDRATKAGIQVMTVVDSANGSTTKYRYVGNDFLEGAGSGAQATQLAKVLNGKGNIVYLKGDAGSAVEQKREKAFKDVISKYPDMKIVFEQNGDWLQPSGQRIMEDALTRFPQPGSITAVAAHDDLMVLGAIQALKRANRLQGVVTAGIDGTIAGCQAVAAGDESFTVFNDAETGGKLAVLTAIDVLDGKKVPTEVDVPWVLIDSKAKANDYLKNVYHQ